MLARAPKHGTVELSRQGMGENGERRISSWAVWLSRVRGRERPGWRVGQMDTFPWGRNWTKGGGEWSMDR